MSTSILLHYTHNYLSEITHTLGGKKKKKMLLPEWTVPVAYTR